MKLRILSIFTILSLILSACSAVEQFIPGEQVTVSIVYGYEKREWLEPLVQQFNEARNQT